MSDPKRWDVLGVGCNSVDYVYRVPALPQRDSPTAKVRVTSHTMSFGGQAATTMAACAALGLRAAYLGAAGNDAAGAGIRGELARRGVDVSLLLTRDCANRFAVIPVDEHTGDRLVLWGRDTRLGLHDNEIRAETIAAARLVHVDDEDDAAAIRAARLAREAGIPATSDIDHITPRTRELVAAVSIPIFNAHALPQLTGESDPERGLHALARSHPDGMLCVTLGERGAMLLYGNELVHEPAFGVDAVDTTGAGDVFRAGFIYALLQGKPPREILRFANAAAAVSCTRAGAMASVPQMHEIESAVSAG
jgi:sugar/nucleoside kinase (ribokinase family)